MENENGTVETSFLSKHVRPTLAWAGFLIYSILLFGFLPALVADKEWGVVGVFLAPLIGFGLWYVGVRSQDKNFEKFFREPPEGLSEVWEHDRELVQSTNAVLGSKPMEES